MQKINKRQDDTFQIYALKQMGFSDSFIRKNKADIQKGEIVLPHFCPRLRWSEGELFWKLFSPGCRCAEEHIQQLGLESYVKKRCGKWRNH